MTTAFLNFKEERCEMNDFLVAYAKCIQRAVDTLERQQLYFMKTKTKPTKEEEESMRMLDLQIMQAYRNLEKYCQEMYEDYKN